MSGETFNILIGIWIALAIILFPVQLFITAPYGRHSSNSWGTLMDNRLGWLIMELISPIIFSAFFLCGDNPKTRVMWLFFTIWNLHYLNRSIIYPFRTRTRGKKIPVAIVVSALIFNLINGSANGYYFGSMGTPYPDDWIFDIRFIIGFVVLITGATINIWSDNILLNLRKPGDTAYKIPKGMMFKYTSCPNHFGEILEWTGFAIMCWNLPALSFAIWTAANLLPRALSHHRWYQKRFAGYPDERKAVIPFVL